MTNLFHVMRAEKILTRALGVVVAIAMQLPYAGAVVALFAFPSVASAATVLLSDSFGTGGSVKDIPVWDEEGDDNASSTVAQSFAVTGEDTASPNDGRFAKIGEDEWICQIVDARNFDHVTLSYYWRGDTDAEDGGNGGVDKGVVEVRKGASCTANDDWEEVRSHKLDAGDNGIHEPWAVIMLALPSAETEDEKFALRFRNVASAETEHFRIDGVSVYATQPENTLPRCTDGIDNDGDEYTDLNDPDCQTFMPKLTVTKVVVGGSAQVSDFALTVTKSGGSGVSVVSGAQKTFMPGSYAVSETNLSNYAGVFSGACNSSGAVTLSAGDTKSCTITNTYVPPAPVCGNGAQEIGEQCDDGNAENGDMCTNQCTAAFCGDAYVNIALEQCDDGNVINNDSCTNQCTYYVPPTECSDGVDNDDDNSTDMNDPGCSSPEDDDETNESEEPSATISATKIVCDSEEDLPNWSGAEMSINADTATNFLSENENCELAEGWKFQSSNQNGFDAGNTFVGEAPAPYVTSGPTNASGVTTWNVPLTEVSLIQVREVLKSGYIPFAHGQETPDVSAEMWCADDVLNYDNWEWISNPQSGATYHCVAFNVRSGESEEPMCGNGVIEEGEQCDDANTVSGDGCSLSCAEEEPLMCDPETNLIANGSFEDPVVSSWEVVLDTNPALKWLVDYVGTVADSDSSHKGIEIQQSGVTTTAFDGNQLAELDGYHPSVIWQGVPTIPGKRYTLSYYYSARPGTDASENTMEVSAGGVVLDTILPTTSGWSPATRYFDATSSVTNFAFKDLGPDDSGDTGGLGMLLDRVVLTCGEIPEDVCPNLQGHQETVPLGYQLEYFGEEETPVCVLVEEDNDVCENIEGFQPVVPEGMVLQGENQCVTPVTPPPGPGGSTPNACSDGSDNDMDGKADFPNDPGCESSIDNDETDTPPPPPAPPSPPGTPDAPEGEVLGATTEEPPLPPSCSAYITTYMKMGKKNDPEEVKKLQEFLNETMGANLPVTGYFGPLTKNWVKKFQKKYHDEIIQPWQDAGYSGNDLLEGTGYVFKTTKRWINIMKCESLKSEPIPELTPDTGNN